MKFNRLTRRMFLQGSGGALVSIPFLTSLLPRETWAQSAGTPIRRFIYVKSPYELGHHASWLPMIGATANLGQPSQVLAGTNGHHSVRWQNLRDFAPTNSSKLLQEIIICSIVPSSKSFFRNSVEEKIRQKNKENRIVFTV